MTFGSVRQDHDFCVRPRYREFEQNTAPLRTQCREVDSARSGEDVVLASALLSVGIGTHRTLSNTAGGKNLADVTHVHELHPFPVLLRAANHGGSFMKLLCHHPPPKLRERSQASRLSISQIRYALCPGEAWARASSTALRAPCASTMPSSANADAPAMSRQALLPSSRRSGSTKFE